MVAVSKQKCVGMIQYREYATRTRMVELSLTVKMRVLGLEFENLGARLNLGQLPMVKI